MTLSMNRTQMEYARQRSMPLMREDVSLNCELQGVRLSFLAIHIVCSVFIYSYCFCEL